VNSNAAATMSASGVAGFGPVGRPPPEIGTVASQQLPDQTVRADPTLSARRAIMAPRAWRFALELRERPGLQTSGCYIAPRACGCAWSGAHWIEATGAGARTRRGCRVAVGPPSGL